MIKAIRAEGRSMEYVIRANDLVLYSEDISQIKNGDVIIYKNQSQDLVCHRLLTYKWLFIIAAGDNCHKFEHIRKKNIIGKLELIISGRVKYELNRDTLSRNTYCKLIRKFIFKTYFMHIFNKKFYMTKNYKKLVNDRNRQQIKYLNECAIK